MMGGAADAALSGALPAGPPGFYALLGMAAAMSGAMRVPLTATFFATEVISNVEVLLPLMAASVTAYAIAVLLMRRSIRTEKVTRRGHHIVCEYGVDPFALTRVRDVMTADVETVPATMTLYEATRFLAALETAHRSFPVVDEANRVLGIIDPPTVLQWRWAGRHRRATLRDPIAGVSTPFAYPDEYVYDAVERLADANLGHLAVVSRDDQSLVGCLGWRDITQMAAETARRGSAQASFFGYRAPGR